MKYILAIFITISFSSISCALSKENILCQSEGCNFLAEHKIVDFQEITGPEINVSTVFKFNITEPIVKLTKMQRSIVVEDNKKHYFVVSDVELEDFGLNSDDKTTLNRFFSMIYLKKYSEIKHTDITSNVLVAIKSYKSSVQLNLKKNVIYFTNEKYSFYTYYDQESTTYEIFIIPKSDRNYGQRLSVIGLSDTKFSKLVSSFKTK